MPPQPPPSLATRHLAFSLVEVVLALGIVAFSLVALLGLFPVGIQLSGDSQRETRCNLIARELFAALRVGPAGSALLSMEPEGPLREERLNLKESGSTFLVFDLEGRPLALVEAAAVEASLAEIDEAVYVAQVRVTAGEPMPGLSRVELFVQYPAAAPAELRRVHPFAGILSTP